MLVLSELVNLTVDTITTSEAITLAKEMMMDFYEELCALYSIASELENEQPHTKQIEILVDRISTRLLNDQIISEYDITQTECSQVQNLYKGLLRVYLYMYQTHYESFVKLGVAHHLSTCCHRLLSFCKDLELIDMQLLVRFEQFMMQSIVNHERSLL